MLRMQVERKSGDYFEPQIFDLADGCVFVFHEDDITQAGAEWFALAMTDQARRWAPRTMGMPLGPVVPVRIDRSPDVPQAVGFVVDDSAVSINYLAHEDLIREHAAKVIGEKLTERSPYWMRVPDAGE